MNPRKGFEADWNRAKLYFEVEDSDRRSSDSARLDMSVPHSTKAGSRRQSRFLHSERIRGRRVNTATDGVPPRLPGAIVSRPRGMAKVRESSLVVVLLRDFLMSAQISSQGFRMVDVCEGRVKQCIESCGGHNFSAVCKGLRGSVVGGQSLDQVW